MSPVKGVTRKRSRRCWTEEEQEVLEGRVGGVGRYRGERGVGRYRGERGVGRYRGETGLLNTLADYTQAAQEGL